MANPYDFSSGFLQARQQRETERKNAAEEEFRNTVTKPYYESVADENRAKARLFGITGREKILEGNVKRAKAIDMFGWDPLGDYTDESPFGFSFAAQPTQPSYGIDQPVQQADPSMPTGGLRIPAQRYANGSIGGVRTQDDQLVPAEEPIQGGIRQVGGISTVDQPAAPTQQPVEQAAQDAQPAATGGMRDPVNILREKNPDAARSIAMNFFTAPMKDIPKMLEKVAKWELFEGKTTSKDVLANVEALRTMQAEGVAQAMSLAMQGNTKAAMKLFSETGSDLGEDVTSLDRIKIKNPVAGSIKGVEDSYDGVKITYKDGRTMDWDPRKFLISTASLKEYLSSKDTVENNLRSTAASKYGDDVRAESNREARATREEQQRNRLEDQAINRITGEARSELSRQTNAFLDPKSPQFIVDEKAREVKNQQIEAGIRPAMDIAVQNVTLFGRRGATVNGVLQAMQNPQPALGANGKPIIQDKNGQPFVMTTSGVWLPVNVNQQK